MVRLLARLVRPSRRRRRPVTPPPYTDVSPYSCPYVGAPTAYRRGEAPLRGEDSPLVRPYLDLVETYA
ncbi:MULTISPECIES: hypothetical protein [Streptomyces]|jgi:hypothetical protein|uniref:Uncharacterized protein n=1 Tax=Streptomyces eurythermus TaxID=42237 RepID=A0ABW6YN79_9ACTN|nr:MULTISPECIES: hypothetical protein [Streptomyces]QIS71221.1 hypothetical protein HB370_15370 [Streptomyces sp. DSM 40868]WDM12461.1 hypothetical protein J3S85_13490 [Streptomyces lavenduligriseus]